MPTRSSNNASPYGRVSRVRSRIRIVDDEDEIVRSAFDIDVRVYAPIDLVGLFERAGLTDVIEIQAHTSVFRRRRRSTGATVVVCDR
jgi:hypothetical protein